jgi:hypothetical protein
VVGAVKFISHEIVLVDYLLRRDLPIHFENAEALRAYVLADWAKPFFPIRLGPDYRP